jgi:hypothetical protein
MRSEKIQITVILVVSFVLSNCAMSKNMTVMQCGSHASSWHAERIAEKHPIAGTGLNIDSVETLVPDPMVRTWVNLDGLRTLLSMHIAQTGSLPASLEELTSFGRDLPLLSDGWNYRILFEKRGGYELRAAAADGLYCTPDDITATEESMPPYPAVPSSDASVK